MTNPIIFLHLPKNGGTTFHSLLNRLYHNEKIFSLTYNRTKSNKEEFINLPKEERYQYKILKGHAPFGLHKHMGNDAKYVTFLRKPETRIPSFYYYILRKPNNKLYKKIVDNDMSLFDFITKINSPDVNNCQIRWISGINDTPEFMLEKAIENIEHHFSFIGLTERYNESLIYLQHIYNWSLPYYTTKNKTHVERKTLDNKTIEAINEFNEHDNILYEYIENQFVNKLNNVSLLQFQLLKLKLANSIYLASYLKNINRIIKKVIS